MADPRSDRGEKLPRNYYDAATIRRSLGHFVLGKGASAIAALLVLYLIVRALSVEEFAAYTSLHALALIIGLLSSLGIPQVLHRYLPELRTRHNNRAMYALLIGGIIVRAAFYGLFCALLLLLLEPITSAFKLEPFYALVPWYFLVGFLRVNATFMAQALENLLWQRDAQYSLAGGGLLKLAGTAYVVFTGELTLETFIWIEVFSEAGSLLMLIAFLAGRLRGDSERGGGDPGVLIADRTRYLRFGFWCYMQNVTSVFYGSAPNRLFVAYFLSPESIAVFGVIDRLIDFAKRYEPLHMFVGLVRPVLMSRYTENADFDRLQRLANLILFANFVILVAPLPVLLAAGDWFLEWMTSGKYTDIAWLLAAFYVVVLITSVANLVDMLVKAVEENRIYLFSNMLLSGSILIAIPLIDVLGLWAVALANLSGMTAALTVVLLWLRSKGYRYRFEWRHFMPVMVSCALATLAGVGASFAGLHPAGVGALAVVVYALALLFMQPLSGSERDKLLEILPARARRMLGASA